MIARHIDREVLNSLVVPYALAWVVTAFLGAVLLVEAVIAYNGKHAASRALRSQSKRDDA